MLRAEVRFHQYASFRQALLYNFSSTERRISSLAGLELINSSTRMYSFQLHTEEISLVKVCLGAVCFEAISISMDLIQILDKLGDHMLYSIAEESHKAVFLQKLK